MVGQNGFLSLAKTAITSAVASLMLTIDEIARAISALEEFLGRYEKASLEVPKVVDEEMAAFDTIVETEKTALMTRIQGGDSAEQGITVRTTETIESEFISWRKVWAWIKQIGKEAKNPEADKRELEERTQSAISQLEECARRECEAFRERVNYHATNHLPRISSRINQLFEALRTAATNFEKWSQIELSIPPFDFDGHGVGGLDYKNFIKHETVVTKEEQAAHRIDFKLLWLIPIKFFPYKKIISTNKDVLTLDVNKLREELELRVQSLTNGASTGFKEQLTTSTNDYKSAIGQHLHIAKDNLKTDRQKEQADYEKKQERVPLLNQLGTRRTELHEQARQVLTGIGATSEVHS
jgi:DNA anti-recombination protein RmuC